MEEHSTVSLTFTPVSRRPSFGAKWRSFRLALLWARFLALTRLNLARVCEQSADLGEYDFHNHRDDRDRAPWHIEGGRFCVRCGKRFRI